MIEAKRTFDKAAIREFMRTPEIAAVAVDDDMSIDKWTPNVIADCWIAATDESKLVSIYHFKPLNSVTLEVHCYVAPEARTKYAREEGWQSFLWIYKEAGNRYVKIVASIADIYPKTISYAKKFGFRQEGINRMSDKVNGVVHDQIMLGVTFDELREKLECHYA